MKAELSPYSKSVYLSPGIDISNDVNSLKRLSVLVALNHNIQIYFDKLNLFNILTQDKSYSYVWYGDYLEISTINKDKFMFIGFLNNSLIGFGNFILDFKEKILKKRNIEHLLIKNLKFNGDLENKTENVNMFGFILPYNNYKSKQNLIQLFNGIKTEDNQLFLNSFANIFEKSIQWRENSPKLKYNNYELIWEDLWVLLRINTFNPEGCFSSKWISPCRLSPYQFDKIAMWDTIHIIESLKWYDLDLAKNMFNHHFEMFRASDGMVAQDKCFHNKKGICMENGNNYTVSQPPIWSYTLLELSKSIGDYTFCNESFEKMEKNITWWENNRYFKEFGLFGYDMPAKNIGAESGLDNSPRFFNQYNGNKWAKSKGNRKLLCVDLNSQMCDYYQNMGVLAVINGNENSNQYFEKAESIIDSIQTYLWDDEQNFFFDYDIDMKCKQPLFSASSFWSLFGGCVLKGKLPKYIEHLKDPNKFWTKLPIPSIALDSQFYTNNMWQGPTWISQNYWIIIGLKRYNKSRLAAELSKKILDYISESYTIYNKFFEYYSPISIKLDRLQRKRSKKGPHPNYIGHIPIHSIFYYGLMGAEILDDNINFYPKWDSLKSDVNFGIYYNQKMHLFQPKMNKDKIIEIYRD